jgi:hypothetical protein
MPCVFRPGRKDDTGGLNRLYPKISEMGGMVAPNTHFWGNVFLANVFKACSASCTFLPLVGMFNN